jgi:hypothetical protein
MDKENDNMSDIQISTMDNNENKALEENSDNKKSNLQNRVIKKPGRTILLKLLNEFQLKEEHYKQLEGFKAITRPKTSATIAFLLFDTIENSLTALKKLRLVSADLRVKFSHYKLFFAISGLNNSSNYNEVKQGLIEYVEKNTQSSVLYCKFYRKNDKYIGCGDLTIDTLKDAIRLLSPTEYLKDFSFNGYSGSFYKFTEKKQDAPH